MRYHALACDYDGTIATDGALPDDTREALEALRRSGRRVVLVTGRELDDLFRVCGDPSVFDAIVAENGAVLYLPDRRELRLLAERPPESFLPTLRERGIERVSQGHVIVATWHPHEQVVLDVIREQGLELQVIFNKGAVMVLPSGVNKATGLRAALAELGLSAHNVVAVGDAENDHAFLSACECAVAVANALPSLKERADWVTEGDHGRGVVQLVQALLEDDLAQLSPRLGRHDIPLGYAKGDRADAAGRSGAGEQSGQRSPGEQAGQEPLVSLPVFGHTYLLGGTSGGGKSTLATGLIERIVDLGYQVCVVDPEGDYSEVLGLSPIGGPQAVPSVDEVMRLCERPDQNVVVDLLGLSLEHRPTFVSALLTRLQELRARTGRPHWIVLDETHQLVPESWAAADHTLPKELEGLLLITILPGQVSSNLLAAVDAVLSVGAEPADSLRVFARAAGVPPPASEKAQGDGAGTGKLEKGELLLWWPRSDAPPVRVSSLPPRSERRRHIRKYAEGELEEDRSFFFRGADGKLNLRAQNLNLFLQIGEGVDEETWSHHLQAGDYSRWVRDAIKDPALADELAAIEKRAAGLSVADARKALRAAIEERYTG